MRYTLIVASFVVVMSVATAVIMSFAVNLLPENQGSAVERSDARNSSKSQRTTRRASTSNAVRINKDRSGHYYANVRINGKRVRALVDTGATSVVIPLRTARGAGVRVSRSDFTLRVNTANGYTLAAPAVIKEIEIGGIRLKNTRAAVLNDDALSEVLIGMSVLEKLSKVSIEDGVMILRRK